MEIVCSLFRRCYIVTISILLSSFIQWCLILWDRMDCSMPGFPVQQKLLECSNSCPSSRWWHPTISSSVIPFSSCLQSFPASGSFPMSQFLASGGQITAILVSASILPMNTQNWFLLGLMVWSPCSPRNSQESSLALQLKSIHSLALSFLYGSTLTSKHDYWKNHRFD